MRIDIVNRILYRREIAIVGSFQYWKRRLAAEVSSVPWLELGALAQQSTLAWDIELDLGDGVCLRLRRC